ncbi:MAG: hypothetical protein EHM79_19245 [Geobacter sp.]|nr:MAG: hypothetical protein EHM79_19245 [Geobacter sp.]
MSDKFTVRFDKNSILKELGDLTDLLRKAGGQFREVLEAVRSLKENVFITFTDEESQLVETFEQLIQAKQSHFLNEELVSLRKTQLLDRVEQTIETKNSEIGHAAEDKHHANQKIRAIAIDVKAKLESAAQLLKSSKKISALSCQEVEEFDLHGDTRFVVEAISDTSPRTAVLDAIRGANETKSLYFNLLGLISGEMNVKNYPDNKPATLKRKLENLFGAIYDCYNNPNESLKYGDSSTSKGNSPGYNSEKYLEILLSQAESKLVFIDQPEDNLGNNFIAEKLVSLIRKKKFRGQVFLVTHNPAIVVYGDAESIIIATNDDQRISYQQLVLEDRQAQKQVCRILGPRKK